jgi:hypothetical protein
LAHAPVRLNQPPGTTPHRRIMPAPLWSRLAGRAAATRSPPDALGPRDRPLTGRYPASRGRIRTSRLGFVERVGVGPQPDLVDRWSRFGHIGGAKGPYRLRPDRTAMRCSPCSTPLGPTAPGRAVGPANDWGSRGRGFKSRQPDQLNTRSEPVRQGRLYWFRARGCYRVATHSCSNAITMTSAMVDEIRLRAHARPLGEPEP